MKLEDDPLSRTRIRIVFGIVVILTIILFSSCRFEKEGKIKTDEEIIDLYMQITYEPEPAPIIETGESEHERKMAMSVIEVEREVLSREIERQREIVEAPTPMSDIIHYAMLKCEEEFGIDNWDSLFRLVNAESSWNPSAVNSTSGACGLFQAYPCFKMNCGLDDFACQLDWGFGYIKNRYQTPNEAWIFFGNNGWY